MEELISYLVKVLVDHPDRIFVREIGSQVSVTYEVHVAEPDMGKVIGREGRIANAIRALVKAAVQKGEEPRKRIQVEFISFPLEETTPKDVQTILTG